MINTNKIRILHTHQIIRSGGVEQRKHLLCKYLSQEKYEQRIVCTEAIGTKPDTISQDGCKIYSTGDMRHPFQINVHRKIQQVIQEFQPHIIHGTVFEGNSMTAINGFLKNVPIVILEETSHPIRRSGRANLLFKTFSLTADAIIGVSPAVTDFLKTHLRIPERKIKLIMNGVTPPLLVNTDTNKNRMRKKHNIPIHAFVIGSVGRMDNDIKRFDLIIEATALLIHKHDIPIYTVLVGDGIMKEKYKALAKQLDIEKYIIFTGYQENVSNYYNMMDSFILASTTESFGLVLIEAWFHSLPLIASNVGGIPYIIDEGANGLLFEQGNLKELCRNIIKLYTHPDLRLALGANGLIKANLKFNSDRYVADIDALYTSLITKKFPGKFN